jgi:hypothetical protein
MIVPDAFLGILSGLLARRQDPAEILQKVHGRVEKEGGIEAIREIAPRLDPLSRGAREPAAPRDENSTSVLSGAYPIGQKSLRALT